MIAKLDILRRKINRLDKDIIERLGLRMHVVRSVGEFKKKHNIPLCDRKRQEEVLKLRIKQGKVKGLDDKFVKKLYDLIFEEAIRIQKSI